MIKEKELINNYLDFLEKLKENDKYKDICEKEIEKKKEFVNTVLNVQNYIFPAQIEHFFNNTELENEYFKERDKKISEIIFKNLHIKYYLKNLY